MPSRSVFVNSLLAAGLRGTFVPLAPASRPQFSTASLRHDLDELWNALIDAGTAPFATSDRAEVTRRYRDVRAALVPTDALDFVLRVSPIFGALHDGHAGVKPDAAFVDRLAVPVCCTVSGDATIVVASHLDAVEPGSTLESIGGVAADRIREITLAGWGGQSERLRIERFASATRIVTTILAGDPPAYDVRWTTPAGIAKRATLPRATVDLPWAKAGTPRYSYRAVGDGSIGLIDYRQCTGSSAFATFLVSTFRTVRERGVRAMIVDIRNNTGGDSDLNDQLWKYLTAKTYTQFGPIVMRSSQFLKALYGKAKYSEIYGDDTWAAPNGTEITYSQAKIGYVRPGPNPLRFEGPVMLLIGPRTFSSALDCAIAAKAYGLATIVGEETSEPVATTGELFEMSTRYTAITGSFTTKYFMPPKALPPGRGVIPDIEVRTTLADEIAGHDPVLERAIAELGKRRAR